MEGSSFPFCKGILKSISIEFIQSKLGKIHIALVGLSGVQKIIASAIDRDTHFASSMNEAFDWLAAKSL
jgi:hypothetical protein